MSSGLATRVVDIRRSELLPVAQASLTLLLIISAYAVLETARDALLLTSFPARALGLVYVAVAICVLPGAALAAYLAERFGVRRTLGGGLTVAAVALVALFATPTRPASVVGIYVAGGLIGAVLVPLFWSLFGSTFTVAQGRRLLSLVSGAGIVGGTLGSTGAAAMVALIPVKSLLLISAPILVVAAALLVRSLGEEPPLRTGQLEAPPLSLRALRKEPFLARIALLVAVSTTAFVTIDFLFKWTVARSVPHNQIGALVARCYAIFNGAALVAQLGISRALVRRIGLAATMGVTPFLLLGGALGALLSGGALLGVLVLKGLDDTLRNSLHRSTTELMYLPLASSARTRAKPVIDGALVRVTQAFVGAILFWLGVAGHTSGRLLAAVVLGLVCLWLLAARNSRQPYASVLRRAIAGDSPPSSPATDPLDMESAEALVQYLAHEDPLLVVGAMSALARRGRSLLIPALVLLHDNEAVLVQALKLFSDSEREDWIARARVLLADRRDPVRFAAARALATHRSLAVSDFAVEASPPMRAYAALHLALADPTTNPFDNPVVAEIVNRTDEAGSDARLGLLSAIADAPADERLTRLLEALGARAAASRRWTEEFARAAASQHAVGLASILVSRLTSREGREAVQSALLSFGPIALETLGVVLGNRSSPRPLRVHIPNSIARFGTKRAAEILLTTIEIDFDGLVRYKSIRALGRLVADHRVRVDPIRVERLAYENTVEHFRLLGLLAALDPAPLHLPTGIVRREVTEKLLLGLLHDKLRQSLERTFRLLKIANPDEDFHRVHMAFLSEDRRARANAAEFLDVLLRKRDQERLRELLRISAEEVSVADQIARAASLLREEPPPSTREGALERLAQDGDATLSALAQLHAAAVSGRPARVVIGSREGASIELALEERAERLITEAQHA